jgi:UDP-glucose 4-epimerase
MKILVTGGTGYIGSHTVVELLQSGYEVVIFDNLSNSKSEVLQSIHAISGKTPAFEQIDLCNEKELARGFEKHKDIKAIIHFAAYKAVGESVRLPLKYFHNNLFSLINVLEWVQKLHINSFVFSSSCTIYGQPDEIPVTEYSKLNKAVTPYGSTKQMAEEILQHIHSEIPLNVISLRYFNPIGAHPSILLGENPIGIPNNLVPYITQTAIGKHEQLSVFGNDYKTKDGTCVRDYIHVVDLAKAHVISLQRLINKENESPFEAYNLGAGRGYSVLEIIECFERISKIKLNYKFVERRFGDIDKIWADNSLISEKLKWNAEFDLEEMLRTAWEWELKQKTS